MNDVNLVINMTFVLVGFYLLILAFRAKYTGFVHQVLILDRHMEWSRCRDKEGYIQYIFFRIVGCGILLSVSGIYSTLASGNVALQFPFYRVISMLAPMIVCIWYMTIINTAGKRYY